jgi:hypothetical protein
VAAIGYPSWVFERAAAGDVLEYDSPQYKFYADVIARGLGRKAISPSTAPTSSCGQKMYLLLVRSLARPDILKDFGSTQVNQAGM